MQTMGQIASWRYRYRTKDTLFIRQGWRRLHLAPQGRVDCSRECIRPRPRIHPRSRALSPHEAYQGQRYSHDIAYPIQACPEWASDRFQPDLLSDNAVVVRFTKAHKKIAHKVTLLFKFSHAFHVSLSPQSTMFMVFTFLPLGFLWVTTSVNEFLAQTRLPFDKVMRTIIPVFNRYQRFLHFFVGSHHL